MKDLRPVRGTYYIASLIAEGEHEHQDFKYSISDARKIARSISAFANNDGGRLLIGVKDNGVVAGVRNEEDIFVVEQAAEFYCVPEIEVRPTAFRVDGGLVVIRVEVDAASGSRPVMVKEADGRHRAYYRVADENIVAPDLMVRSWRESSADRLFRIGEAERSAISLLHTTGYLTAGLLASEAGISQASAEEILISLYSMELVRWHYTAGSFRLIPAGHEKV